MDVAVLWLRQVSGSRATESCDLGEHCPRGNSMKISERERKREKHRKRNRDRDRERWRKTETETQR